MIEWLAESVQATGTEKLTRILALFVEAGLLKATVGVISTALNAAVVLADFAQCTNLVLFAVVVGNWGVKNMLEFTNSFQTIKKILLGSQSSNGFPR